MGIDLLKTDTSVRPSLARRTVARTSGRSWLTCTSIIQLPTGRAIIQLSDSTRDNSIVLLPGSNFSPSSPTIPNLSTYSHLLLQNEIPLTETRSILVKAHASGLTTIFNPSPMLTLSELEAFEWSSLDWLLVNEGEANELVKVLGTGKEEGSVLDRLRKVPVLSGLAGILMTKGGDGVAAAIGGPDGETVETGAGKVVGGVKDTTGAGDCFTVSDDLPVFASGTLELIVSFANQGFFATLVSTAATPLTADALKSILLVASQAGAMCVEKEGAMESVPSLAEVKQRMEGGWPAGPWETLLA